MRPLDPDGARDLAESLPDDPFSVEARCALLRGFGEGWKLAGGPGEGAALVRDRWQPTEPRAFGDDPDEIWVLLREVAGWDCVNCSEGVAPGLRDRVVRELQVPATILPDLYYVLGTPPSPFDHPAVRRLSERDLTLVESASEPLRPTGYDSLIAALTGGIVAGAIADDRLVATNAMTASSETYANLSAHTLPEWRDRGFGRATATLVARIAQDRGLEPVWSTAATNLASQCVARKVGFEEYGRRAYVVVPHLQATGGFRPLAASHG